MAKLKKNRSGKQYISDKMIGNLKWDAIRQRLNKKSSKDMVITREKPVPKHWM